MWNKPSLKDKIDSLSKLDDADYGAVNNELDNIYKRLKTGRNAFALVYNLNVDAVAQISALNLQINYYIDKLLLIAENVEQSSNHIYQAAADATEVAECVSKSHEELTNTILEVSDSSANVLAQIETGQNELTNIRSLSNNTINESEVMHQDMENLSSVINEMTKVIDGINAISSQTNLLSLNASIEAARAGEAGKGFAVVADEIRDLADETQNLTKTMAEFIEGVRTASVKSADSVEKTIVALKTVNEKISEVWNINEDNQRHVANITNSISNLAAVSEEISSSMIEIEARSSEIESSCKYLSEDATNLNVIGKNSADALKPLTVIETGVDDLLVKMGKMSIDPYYSLSRDELITFLDKAISAHKTWVEKLEEIVKSRSIIAFQVDGRKCHFGHFYNSIEPPIPELKSIWHEIGDKHKELHRLGGVIIKDLFDENTSEAEKKFIEVKKNSEELIGLLEKIKSMIPKRSSEL